MTAAGRRRAVVIGAALLWIVVARLWYGALAAPQTTGTDVDSRIFLEIAAQPASVDHLAYPKPWTTPAVYRLVDAQPDRIVALQRELAFAAWTILGVALVALQRRTATRVAAALVALALLLAPARVGFTGAILSESIADSLLALVVAGALGLARLAPEAATSRAARRGTIAIAAALAVVAPLWILARDIHALCAIIAVAVAIAWWRPWRDVARRPRAPALALVVLVLVVAAIGLYSSGQVPARPTHVSYHAAWPDEARPRAAIPTINNLFRRVLPDPDAVAFYRARGLPMVDELAPFRGQYAHAHGEVFLSDARFLPVHRWLRAHGTRTYLLWRLRDPVGTTAELWRHRLALVGAQSLAAYMPPGWRRAGDDFPLAGAFRGATAWAPAVLLLLALAPLGFRYARGPARGVAACAIAAGLLGAVAAVLADAAEVRRHAWGPSQLVLLGALVVALAAADALGDRLRARLTASRRPDPRPAAGDR